MTWTNTGTVLDSATIEVGDASGGTATIDNAVGGVFEITADTGGIANNNYSVGTVDAYGNTSYNNYAGSSTFDNAGLLTKITQPGHSYIASTMDNTGTITVATGTLEFDGGGTFGGTINGAGTIAFGGGTADLTAASLTTGALLIDGADVVLPTSFSSYAGALTVTAGTAQLSADLTLSGSLALSNGVIDLNGHTLSVSAPASFASAGSGVGAIDGPGTLATSGTTTLSPYLSGYYAYWVYTAAILGGGLTWTNTGTVLDSATIAVGDASGGTATIDNAAGAVFEIAADSGGISNNSYSTSTVDAYGNTQTSYFTGSSTFDNAGLLTKITQPGSSFIASTMDNTGTITVATGTLEFDGGGTFGGTLNGAGTIAFGNGTADLTTAAALATGGLLINGADVLLPATLGTYAGALTISRGTLQLASDLTVSGSVSLAGGTIDLNGHTLTLSGGVTTGNIGTIDGAGTLATSGTAYVNGINLGGGLTWKNSGTVSDTGIIYVGDPSGGTVTIDNAAGAVFEISADTGGIANNQYPVSTVDAYGNTTSSYYTGSSTFDNAGLLTKITQPGSSTIASTMDSTGTIAVATGTLEFNGGGTFGGTIEGAGTIAFGGGTADLTTAATLATGGLLINGADVLLPTAFGSYAGALTVSAGTATLASNLTLTGSLTGQGYGLLQLGGNTLTASGGATLSGGTIDGPGTLTTGGTTTLGGNYDYLGGGLTWTNTGTVYDTATVYGGDAAGGTIAIDNAAGAVFVLNSSGANVRNSYYYTTTIDANGNTQGVYLYGASTFSNAGLIQKTIGISTIDSVMTNTGTINVVIGVLQFDGGGTFGGTIDGAGTIAFGGGTADLTAGTTLATGGVSITNAELVDAGAVTGSVSIGSGGTLDLAGVTLGASSLALGYGTLYGHGSVTTPIANGGIIEANGGALHLTGTLSGTGGLQVDAGATLDLAGTVAENVTYGGLGATLLLEQPGAFSGTLENITAGTRLVLQGDTVTAATATGTILAVTLNTGATLDYTLGAAAPSSMRPGITVAGGNSTIDFAIYRSAIAQVVPTSVTLGAVHQGSTATQALVVRNVALGDGYSENLDATVAGTSAGVTATGSVSLLPALVADTQTITVGIDTSSLGAVNGSATLDFYSDGSGVDGNGTLSLGSQPVQVSGTVYALAAPTLSASTIDLGATRVGGATLAGNVQLYNGGASSPYQESLVYSDALTASGVSGAGIAPTNGSGTITSGNWATLGFGLASTTAGSFVQSGHVSLTSTGVGTSGLADTTLTTQTLTVTGKVYALASASAPGSLDFGIVHVGDLATQTLSVSNTGTGVLVDSLTGGWGAVSAGFTGSGNLGQVAAGSSGNLSLAMATNASGTFSGTGTLSLASHDGQLSDVALSAGTVAMTGTVDNYATAAFQEGAGTGQLGGGGTSWVLNLGTLLQSGGTDSVQIGALNAASGLADTMGGSYTVNAATGFTNTGFASFSGLGAGQADTAPTIDLSTAQTGTFTETVVLDATGSNASGYSGTLTPTTLTVEGVVAATLTGTGNFTTLAAPAITGISPDTGPSGVLLTASPTIQLSGTGAVGTTIDLARADIGAIGTATVNASGVWNFDYTGTTLSDGSYVFTATAVNAAGDMSRAAAAAVTIDAAPPSTPTVSTIVTQGAVPQTLTNGATTNATGLTFDGSAAPGDTVTLSDGTTVLGSGSANPSGGFALQTSAPLSAGTHVFSLVATDAAGVSSVAATETITVDTHTPAAPSITGISPDTGVSASDGITASNRIKVSGTGEAGDTVTLSVDNVALATALVAAGGAWTADLTGIALADGTHSLTAVQTDAAGTTSTISPADSVTIAAGATTALDLPAQVGAVKIYYLTPAELLAGPRPIDPGTATWNTLMFPTSTVTLTDAAFTGLNHFSEIDLLGSGAQSVTLGANAAAAFNGYVVVNAANAASSTIDGSGLGSAGLAAIGTTSGINIVHGGNGANWIVGGGGADQLYGGAGNDIFMLPQGELGVAGLTIDGGGGWNEIWLQGSNTITDAAFAQISSLQEVDFVSAATESITLGPDAGRAMGSVGVVRATDATNVTIDASAVGLTNMSMFAGTGTDLLIGGAGNDYMVAGSGVDTFEAGLGTDWIKGFVEGVDVVKLQTGGFTSFTQLQGAMTMSGSDTIIRLGNGNSIDLIGVKQSSLTARDFAF
ncbi:MAG: Ig-like domain-containing protein [Rhodospirillales bacterium]|nr:Ig-like domain-containing protein [Rhodospirillales bacterium]